MTHYRHHYVIKDNIVLGCKIIYLFLPSIKSSTTSPLKKKYIIMILLELNTNNNAQQWQW